MKEKKYQSHSNCEVLKGPRGTGSSSSRHLTDTGGAFHHYSCADFSAPLPGPQGATSFLLSASPAGHQRVTAPPATSCFFFLIITWKFHLRSQKGKLKAARWHTLSSRGAFPLLPSATPMQWRSEVEATLLRRAGVLEHLGQSFGDL